MSNRSCLCCRDVGPKGTNDKHRLEEHFNSGILTGGKTRMAPKPSKTTTAWWLASNSQNMPLIIKCQINSQLKPDLPQHKPGSPWENWSLPTTSQLHLVCTTLSLLRTILDPVAVPKLWFLCSCLCCRDLGSIANKDSLEEHLRHVASILASGKTRMAPKTNKSNVHVGWHRTRKPCQWPWNVKSTISWSQIFPNTNLHCLAENWSLPTTSQLHLFSLHDLYSGPF